MDIQSRFSIGMAVTVFAICLGGCITITKTSTGDFDFDERFDKAAKEIVARSTQAEEAALKGQRVSVDPKLEQFVQRHFVKADELVLTHISAVKRVTMASGVVHDIAVNHYSVLKSHEYIDLTT